MKVGDVLETTVERMGQKGEGVATFPDGRLLFVPGALPGENIVVTVTEIRKNFGRGRLQKIEKPSSFRRAAPCPVFSQCGGCVFQHWDYREELHYKETWIRESLRRIGHIENPPVEPIRGASHPQAYRNKGQFPWGGQAGNVHLGLYRTRSHQLVGIDACAIQRPEVNEVLAQAPAIVNAFAWAPYDELTHQGLLRHLVIRSSQATHQVLLLIVATRDDPQSSAVAQRFMTLSNVAGVGLNINSARTNRILGDKTRTLAGRDRIPEQILGLTFDMSFTSFFQVNPEQVETLYQLALDACGNHPGTVWDLYAGVGTLAALVAQNADAVTALEINPDAIGDARANFARNHLDNVTIYEGAAEDLVPKWVQAGKRADVVMVDPPRSGMQIEVVRALLSARPSKIVYVSCNPDTLARDVALLEDVYQLTRVTPVDMFPWTDHVESCAVLIRRP